MNAKWVEIRDRGTTIPALALRPGYTDPGTLSYPAEEYLIERAGFSTGPGGQVILLAFTGDMQAAADPIEWTRGQQMLDFKQPQSLRAFDRAGNPVPLTLYRCPVVRTLFIAHYWLTNGGFDSLASSCQVIDVEFICRETDTIKTPDMLWTPEGEPAFEGHEAITAHLTQTMQRLVIPRG